MNIIITDKSKRLQKIYILLELSLASHTYTKPQLSTARSLGLLILPNVGTKFMNTKVAAENRMVDDS